MTTLYTFGDSILDCGRFNEHRVTPGALIPDRPFTFGELIAAQASGDASVLAEHDRPVLTLTLTDPAANIATLFDAVG